MFKVATRKSTRSVPSPVIALAGTLDLVAAVPLAMLLLKRRGSNVSLDASAVRSLGGQCLQVLLSAIATWRTDGHRLDIVSPSTEFSDALTLLGAETHIHGSGHLAELAA